MIMSHSRELLIGNWFGQSMTTDNQQSFEQAFFSSDGSFEFIFSSYHPNGELSEQVTEFGDWGIVGDIHFTFTKMMMSDDQSYIADLADADNYQAYRVLQLNNQRFAYQHVVSGEQYALVRVTDEVGHC